MREWNFYLRIPMRYIVNSINATTNHQNFFLERQWSQPKPAQFYQQINPEEADPLGRPTRNLAHFHPHSAEFTNHIRTQSSWCPIT